MNHKTSLHRFALLSTLVILAGGAFSLALAEKAFHVVLVKERTPLQSPLRKIPKTLGDFVVRHGWVDQHLSSETVQVLGTRTYLMREYWYKKIPFGESGSTIKLNINFYPTNFATPHVPNVCWNGVGLKRVKDSIISVKDVPHAYGKPGPIPMRFLSFSGASTETGGLPLLIQPHDGGRYLNTAYVFQVDGRYVPNTQQVSALFWRQSSKFGYDAKIEVDVEGLCTRTRALRVITAFMRSALPSIEHCLPDWKKLNSPAAAGPDHGKKAGSGSASATASSSQDAPGNAN